MELTVTAHNPDSGRIMNVYVLLQDYGSSSNVHALHHENGMERNASVLPPESGRMTAVNVFTI